MRQARKGREHIESAFAELGLRASVQPFAFPAYAEADDAVHIRVTEDRFGELFDIRYQPQLPVAFAVGVPPRRNHLVLVASDGVATLRFLCGRSGDRYFARPHHLSEPAATA